jgi:hypothetical protein
MKNGQLSIGTKNNTLSVLRNIHWPD